MMSEWYCLINENMQLKANCNSVINKSFICLFLSNFKQECLCCKFVQWAYYNILLFQVTCLHFLSTSEGNSPAIFNIVPVCHPCPSFVDLRSCCLFGHLYLANFTILLLSLWFTQSFHSLFPFLSNGAICCVLKSYCIFIADGASEFYFLLISKL